MTTLEKMVTVTHEFEAMLKNTEYQADIDKQLILYVHDTQKRVIDDIIDIPTTIAGGLTEDMIYLTPQEFITDLASFRDAIFPRLLCLSQCVRTREWLTAQGIDLNDNKKVIDELLTFMVKRSMYYQHCMDERKRLLSYAMDRLNNWHNTVAA